MSTSRKGLLKIILENPNEQLTSGCGRRECFYLILMAPLKAIALMPLSLAPTYPLIFLEQNTKSAVADQSCSQTVATTPKIHKTTFDKSRKHIQLIDETALRKTFDNFIPLSSSWRILKCPMKETLPSHRFKNLTIPPIYCLLIELLIENSILCSYTTSITWEGGCFDLTCFDVVARPPLQYVTTPIVALMSKLASGVNGIMVVKGRCSAI